MSWRDAPLYVHAHDLAAQVVARVTAMPEPERQVLGQGVADIAQELLDQGSVALTFPDGRASSLAQADAALVRLRVRLRLCLEAGLTSSGWHRQATERISLIGRMLGGWRKRVAAHPPTGPPDA